MQLETAARRHLLSLPAVTGYVVGKVFKFTLLESPERSGGCAIVVRRQVGWAVPDTVKTSEFPRLVIECWADCTRDLGGNKKAEDAADKALALYKVVDRALHGKRDMTWGAGGADPGLRIVTCVRSGEPAVLTELNTPSLDRPVQLGEMAMVPVVYNLQVG